MHLGGPNPNKDEVETTLFGIKRAGTSQATTPDRAERGALAGTGSTGARGTPMVTTPGRGARMAAGGVRRGAAQWPCAGAGRTCSRGASGAGTRRRGAARRRRRE